MVISKRHYLTIHEGLFSPAPSGTSSGAGSPWTPQECVKFARIDAIVSRAVGPIGGYNYFTLAIGNDIGDFHKVGAISHYGVTLAHPFFGGIDNNIMNAAVRHTSARKYQSLGLLVASQRFKAAAIGNALFPRSTVHRRSRHILAEIDHFGPSSALIRISSDPSS
jgi:hypothetical protein